MFTDRSKSHADACRFCWMCRHICPVGLTSGKEGNTPRGKALIVSMDSRNIPLDGDAAELMYECCLCAACSNDCVTGYDPPMFIRESRTKLVAEGLVPAHIQQVIDNAMEGRLFSGERDEGLEKRIAQLPRKADFLLLFGDAAAYRSAQSAIDLMSVLRAAGVEFTALQQEPATGAALADLIGYTDEVRQIAKACAGRIMESGAKTIVILDPSDARFIKQQWGEWGIEYAAEAVTATSFLAKLLEEGKLSLKPLFYQNVTYHDPCRLARDLAETDEARKLIKALGISLKEMFLNGKLTKCCSGAVFNHTNPNMSRELVHARWKDAAEVGASMVVTACPACHYIMGGNVPEGSFLRDLYSLLAEAV